MRESDGVPGDGLGRFVARLDRLLAPIERAFNLIAALFIFGLMLIGVAQVLGRKLLNMPVFGYIDLIEISMAVFAFLGIAWCERLGGHVRMDLFLARTRGRFRWFAEIVGTLVAMFVIAVLAYYGFEHFLRAYEFGDSTIDAEYPIWPSKLVVPVSFGLLWLRLLVHLLGYLRLFARPRAQPVAVPMIAGMDEIVRHEIKEVVGEEAPPAGGSGHA